MPGSSPRLDLLVLLLNVRTFGGHDTHALLTRRAAAAGYDRDDLVATIAGFAGYYLDAARRPPPPNVPGLRRSSGPGRAPRCPGCARSWTGSQARCASCW